MFCEAFQIRQASGTFSLAPHKKLALSPWPTAIPHRLQRPPPRRNGGRQPRPTSPHPSATISDHPLRLAPPSPCLSGTESAGNGPTSHDLDVAKAASQPATSGTVSLDPPLPPTPGHNHTPVAPPLGRPAFPLPSR